MSPDEILRQYGPVVTISILSTLAILRVLVALGIGQAAKVTASANVLNAKAEERRAESVTQVGMTNMAFEMLQEQRANHARNDVLYQDITELKVALATVTAEKKGHADSVTRLLTQIGLIEENREHEKKEARRLEAELNALRGEMEVALNKLIAASLASEARQAENQQLRATNAALERENGEYRQRIGELETKVAQLIERIQQLEAETSKSKPEEEPSATPLPELAIEGDQV